MEGIKGMVGRAQWGLNPVGTSSRTTWVLRQSKAGGNQSNPCLRHSKDQQPHQQVTPQHEESERVTLIPL